jgi:hypothetical protein
MEGFPSRLQWNKDPGFWILSVCDFLSADWKSNSSPLNSYFLKANDWAQWPPAFRPTRLPAPSAAELGLQIFPRARAVASSTTYSPMWQEQASAWIAIILAKKNCQIFSSLLCCSDSCLAFQPPETPWVVGHANCLKKKQSCEQEASRPREFEKWKNVFECGLPYMLIVDCPSSLETEHLEMFQCPNVQDHDSWEEIATLLGDWLHFLYPCKTLRGIPVETRQDATRELSALLSARARCALLRRNHLCFPRIDDFVWFSWHHGFASITWIWATISNRKEIHTWLCDCLVWIVYHIFVIFHHVLSTPCILQKKMRL